MRSILTSVAILCLTASSAAGQGVATRMQSLDPYLMEEPHEIALAISAAPEHVSKDATVLLLRRDGYHAARTGTNGFTCLVERSWSSPIGPLQDFFNPGAPLAAIIVPMTEFNDVQEVSARTNLGLPPLEDRVDHERPRSDDQRVDRRGWRVESARIEPFFGLQDPESNGSGCHGAAEQLTPGCRNTEAEPLARAAYHFVVS